MRERGALCVTHVLQQRARGADRQRQLVRPEALEIESAELVGEQPRGARELEVPGRARTQHHAGRRERLGTALGDQELRGLEPLELGRECALAAALEYGEASRGEVDPGEPEALSVTGQRGGESVVALLEERGVRDGAGCDDAHHLALERAASGSRLAFLLTDCDALAFAHEARQVGVERVERHTRHRDWLAGGGAARGERDVEERGGAARVVMEQLVKVTHPVEQQDVRVLRLDAQVLLHHRRVLLSVVQGF